MTFVWLATDLASKADDPSDLSALTVQRELEKAWCELLSVSAEQANVQIKPTIQDAIAHVRDQAGSTQAQAQSVLVTGSLHLVGGVMAHLQHEGTLDERLVSTVSP